MKLCAICGEIKPDESFAVRGDGRGDGLLAHCLDCQAIKNRQHYEANREAIKARARERKRQIRAGTYVPASTTHARQKRRIDVPPPQIALNTGVYRLDDAEAEWLRAEAERLGVREDEVIRRFVRAAMSAIGRRGEDGDV